MAQPGGPGAFKTAIPRILKAFGLHLVVFILFGLAIYFLSSGETALSETIRTNFADNPEQLRQIGEDAVWQLLTWCLLALAASWIIASLWLFTAERCRPAVPAEGSSRLGSWAVGLFATLAAAAVIGWRLVWSRGVSADFSSGTLFLGMVLVIVAVLLAYYLATAMFVKLVMKRSVPFSSLLPHY